MSNYFVHSSSFIDDNVTIGNNTKIWYFCHIQSNAVIGEKLFAGAECQYFKFCKNR